MLDKIYHQILHLFEIHLISSYIHRKDFSEMEGLGEQNEIRHNIDSSPICDYLKLSYVNDTPKNS